MITPIQSNGFISQTPNINIIRQAEEDRPQTNYNNVQNTIDTKEQEKAQDVVAADNSDSTNTRHDAREESKNKYFDMRDKNKKKKQIDTVVIKKSNGGGFDFRV